MTNLFRDNAFRLGFMLALLLFLGLNIYSAIKPGQYYKICFDCYKSYGFPFDMHESATILHLDEFIWSGVVANLAIALVSSFFLGYLLKFFRLRIALRRGTLT